MQIAIPLFPRLTALDAIGPYEVLQRLPGAEVVFCGSEPGEVRTENGYLGLTVDRALDEVPRPDVIIVPGGIGSRALDAAHPITRWVRAAHETTRFTTSVCTGSLVLGAAGVLDGLTATTHWACYAELEGHGATAISDRVVEHLDRRIITAAGVSSGIDMALRLAELLVDRPAAEAMQLMVEYDPQPPFSCGSLDKASPEVIERVAAYSREKD
ncbi:MAG: DJ-1/PfpI family protein [Baekduia sp.]